MWSTKYCPQHVKHIILEDNLRDKIEKFIAGDFIPNIIISSPSGAGKSILIDCIAKDFYGAEYSSHVCKLNTSIEKNIKKLQDDMELFCKKKMDDHAVRKTKLYIIDDIDNISEKIQNVIASIMINYKNINFLFSCCLSSNIIDIIQTHCVIIRLQKPTNENLISRLELICKKEKCSYDKVALDRICFISQNDIRTAINKIQILANEFLDVSLKGIDKICDTPNIITLIEIINLCLTKDVHKALDKSLALYNDGFNCVDILTGIFEIVKTTAFDEKINHVMTEKIKIQILSLTGKMIYKVSRKIDSKIQLEKYVIKFCDI